MPITNPHDVSCFMLPTPISLEQRLAQFPRYRLAFLAVAALLLATQISPWWYPTQDGCSYLSIARNFADGKTERLGVQHIYYAPGYPLLIAPAFWISERPFLLLSIVHWALAVGVLLGVYRWSARYACVPTPAALLIAATTVLCAAFWDHLRVTQSEILFMGSILAAVLVLNRLSHERRLAPTIIYAVLGATLVILAGMIRHFGVAIACGFGLRMLIDAMRHQVTWPRAIVLSAAVGLPAGAAVLGLITFDGAMARENQALTYVDYFRDPGLWRDVGDTFAARLSESVRLRVGDVGRLTLPGMFKAYGDGWFNPSMIVYIPFAVLLSIGWWRLARRTGDVFALAAPFYIGLYAFWPFSQGTRYIFPMLPLLVVCLWYAIEPLQRARLRILGGLLASHLLVALGYWAKELPEIAEENQLWSEIDTIASHIRTAPPAPAPPAPPPPSPPHAAMCFPSNRPWLMLQFALDRRAEKCRDPSAVSRNVTWLIAPTAQQNIPAGFKLGIPGEQLNLWHREQSPAPPSTQPAD